MFRPRDATVLVLLLGVGWLASRDGCNSPGVLRWRSSYETFDHLLWNIHTEFPGRITSYGDFEKWRDAITRGVLSALVKISAEFTWGLVSFRRRFFSCRSGWKVFELCKCRTWGDGYVINSIRGKGVRSTVSAAPIVTDAAGGDVPPEQRLNDFRLTQETRQSFF